MKANNTSTRGMAVLMSIALVLAFARPVAASNFGSTSCGGSPNNCISVSFDEFHRVAFSSVTTMYSPTITSMWNDYDPTDLVVTETTNSSIADVTVYDGNYGLNGAAGWVECFAGEPDQGGSHPNHWCQGQSLRYNYSYSSFFNDATSLAYIACHELGHTIGLRHTGDSTSCMTADTPNGAGVLNTHDRSHINSYSRYQ